MRNKVKLYSLKEFISANKSFELICFKNKIVIVKSLQKHVIDWYHNYLRGPQINRTEETIEQHLSWPKMQDQITESVCICANCQRNKHRHNKYGHLPENEAEASPY